MLRDERSLRSKSDRSEVKRNRGGQNSFAWLASKTPPARSLEPGASSLQQVDNPIGQALLAEGDVELARVVYEMTFMCLRAYDAEPSDWPSPASRSIS